MEHLPSKPIVSYIDRPDAFMYIVHAVDFGYAGKTPKEELKFSKSETRKKFDQFLGTASDKIWKAYHCSMVGDIPLQELEEAVGDGTLRSRISPETLQGNRFKTVTTYAGQGFILKPDPTAPEHWYYPDQKFTRGCITRSLSDVRESEGATHLLFPGSLNTQVIGIFYRSLTQEQRRQNLPDSALRAQLLQDAVYEINGEHLPIKELQYVSGPREEKPKLLERTKGKSKGFWDRLFPKNDYPQEWLVPKH